MTTKNDGGRWYRRFGTHLLLIMILITLPLVGLILAVDCQQAEEALTAGDELLREQTEKSVVQSVRLVDAGLKLFDGTLDSRMEEGFGPVTAEYERAGRDAGAMDLSRVQEELGGEVDIYVINESGIVEYTTYPPDLGLDFREIPYFFDRVTEIRLGDAFVADRVVTEPAGGMLRKYAYLPSPDHRYVFELGLVCNATEADRYAPDYQTLKEDLMRLNPALTEIRFFDRYGRPINVTEADSPVVPATVDPVAVAVIEEGESRTFVDGTAGTITRYLLVDLSDPGSPSDTSRVAELTYTTAPLEARIMEVWRIHAAIVLVLGLAACCIAIPASRRITRPVRELVDDVDRIASGDLDHRVRVSAGTEFARLSESIGITVDSLKGNIQRLRESEEALRQYSARLEEQVQERTADLEESNRAANLFLDIMVHDINNANTVAIGYTQFLVDALEGERRETAGKMLGQLEQSSAIIGRVATLRMARASGAALRPVDLDRAIREQAAGHPAVRYEGRPVDVLADDLLPEVFSNLIGNVEKFGGPDVEIAIQVEDRGEDLLVSVEDDGPGIPDAVKGEPFRRFRKGSESFAGTGLGLYICRTLIERYGGEIRAEDRVPGHPGSGTAIRFSLRKAPKE
ncbi:HAMP domain-containing histidine kinase [Methanoculleus sp. Afa-1]|uniref:histidine kinase n=1 Tax=Methanoculleus formosensis TaxID=2590886 RepID=A0A9E5DEV4_9EURY|nr:HAMP domain-containing sensor histidine kinase [Methanoculleus sp. Afa-1]MCT8338099.1 HAMP domain-containing histidine kinase [Methanoculleus sp. Afa-1]